MPRSCTLARAASGLFPTPIISPSRSGFFPALPGTLGAVWADTRGGRKTSSTGRLAPRAPAVTFKKFLRFDSLMEVAPQFFGNHTYHKSGQNRPAGPTAL